MWWSHIAAPDDHEDDEDYDSESEDENGKPVKRKSFKKQRASVPS